MKLSEQYVTQELDGTLYLVPLGGEAFFGMIRCNGVGAELVELLREQTTEAALVDALCAEYDAPRAAIAADVAEFLAALRKANALDEA